MVSSYMSLKLTHLRQQNTVLIVLHFAPFYLKCTVQDHRRKKYILFYLSRVTQKDAFEYMRFTQPDPVILISELYSLFIHSGL